MFLRVDCKGPVNTTRSMRMERRQYTMSQIEKFRSVAQMGQFKIVHLIRYTVESLMQVTAGSDVRLHVVHAKRAACCFLRDDHGEPRMNERLRFSYHRMRLFELRKYLPRCSIVNLSWIALGRSSDTERGRTRPVGLGSVDDDCSTCRVVTLGEVTTAGGSCIMVHPIDRKYYFGVYFKRKNSLFCE